ncbi:hypothetical protein VITFI_CDS2253 [Vitreoscilla filiformis]|uniref:Uncharacterized protein n=1 Tax=Vitreoscilla filiformis TaxID=63 RepID=A0A221KG85_VITFI|nr:hypothetical protein [Vitreoscilla filiformis]ASM78031.1 hypothetical protein VITFI_CDS2253 [Vitreoscilla filiformis]
MQALCKYEKPRKERESWLKEEIQKEKKKRGIFGTGRTPRRLNGKKGKLAVERLLQIVVVLGRWDSA